MAADWDAPRTVDISADGDRIDEVKVRGVVVTALNDLDVLDDEPLDLPGADPTDEELVARIVPRQADEFMCVGCYLVQHKSRAVRRVGDDALCPECA